MPKLRKATYDVVGKDLQKLECFEKDVVHALEACNYVGDTHYRHNVAQAPKTYDDVVKKKNKTNILPKKNKRILIQAQCFKILSQ